MARPKQLALSDIRLDGGTQVRVSIDLDTVAAYAERMEEGDVFRAVDVYHDGASYWLADGFHRWHAAKKAGRDTLAAIVKGGTLEDAIWDALTANKTNGLPMSNADKAKAVGIALKTFPDKTDQVVADRVGVHRNTVAKYRHPTCTNCASRTGRDGRKINTSKIGKAKRPLVDQVGRDLMALDCAKADRIREAFRRRDQVTTLMSDLSQIKTFVIASAGEGDELFAALNVSAFQADLSNAYRSLRAVRPHAVCPYCGGRGCQACGDRGWVGEFVYGQAPAEMREAKS
jgi:hypothetical protein